MGDAHSPNFSTTLMINGTDVTTFTSNFIISILIALLLVVGTLGNVLSMVVIIKNSQLHTISNCFIFSLCVSDLISALVCSPLWLYRRTWGFQEWKWHECLCIFYWTTDFTTNYATSLHILSFAALRFYAVKRPFGIVEINKRSVLIYIGALWLISMLVALPINWMVGVQDRESSWPSCSILEHTDGDCCVDRYSRYMAITSPIFFYFPMICIAGFSSSIAYLLLKRCRWRMSCLSLKPNCASSPNTAVKSECSRRREQVTVFDGSSNGNQCFSPSLQNLGKKNDSCSETKSISPTGNDASVVINKLPPDTIYQGQSGHPKKSTAVKKPGCSAACPSCNRSVNYLQYSREKRIFTQLALIVIAFMIGYIPQSVYLLWTSTWEIKDDSPSCSLDYWFGVASYLCLRLSECMNPLMYNLGSSNMRHASKVFLRKFACRFRKGESSTINQASIHNRR